MFPKREYQLMLQSHIVHWGINSPQKHHPLFFAKPPLNLQTVQALFVSRKPLLEIGFFIEPSY